MSCNTNATKVLSNNEKNKILFDFNNTHVFLSAHKTIHELLEEQADRTPDKIALICKDRYISYKELNKRTTQLAVYLRKQGVEKEAIVGIMVERSIEMIIAIFGILKAGGAYLPIDPEYPVERIKYVLADSNTRFLISQSELMDIVDFNGAKINILDENVFSDKTLNLDNINTWDNLSYVIYTSGSTGKPKGVMIEHKAVNNFIKGITNIIDFKPGKKILVLTTISFDIFVLEAILPLAIGLTVIIAGEREHNDPGAIIELIKKHNIDMLCR